MKYEIWNAPPRRRGAVEALMQGGYGKLTATVLAARGICSTWEAHQYLSCRAPLGDPLLLADMDRAVLRVAQAMAHGERIAVYGDYDVDGITATCLLTEFLRSCGCDCMWYIPSRLEEGYGLNPMAIRQLSGQGVRLIITVDCGITAVEEARLCQELGMDLVITDHHECKQELPQAAAVVDPHRPDDPYPHKALSGVGVAFKLVCALSGQPQQMLDEYGDLLCLGTVADVMLLQGENRTFVAHGLDSLRRSHRPGLQALIRQSGCTMETLDAERIGYKLAPRLNAAGRMGQIELAVELLLTQDENRAEELAAALCELNSQRQAVEAEIFAQAAAMVSPEDQPRAIVLADERWHQGVVGIVANQIAEEYGCPAFLICLDGDHGKASSRSYGGFNLFASLNTLSPLLESYGGHELAAGFTISRENIPEFRSQISALAETYYAGAEPRTTLTVDCAVTPDMLTLDNFAELAVLEPCGNGCPKPLLVLPRARIERINPVGSGRHTRLMLSCGGKTFSAIFFSATPESASIALGDVVDVAFRPQINDFRGEQSVQLKIEDIRPSCMVPCPEESRRYQALCAGTLTPQDAAALLPDRKTLGMVWRYLSSRPEGTLVEGPICLCRKIVRQNGVSLSLEQLLVCLDIFADVSLVQLTRHHRQLQITPADGSKKADLNQSQTMQKLIRIKEG